MSQEGIRANQEISNNSVLLRQMVGLPIVIKTEERGSDKFYKYLVRRIYTYDTFGIFTEYDRCLDGKVPNILKEKIKAVKDIVSTLSDPSLGILEKHRMFQNLVDVYKSQYDIID